MDDAEDILAVIVDGLVKRELGRGAVSSLDCAVGMYADDIVSREISFVDSRR